jgi:hypothetical protein
VHEDALGEAVDVDAGHGLEERVGEEAARPACDGRQSSRGRLRWCRWRWRW